MIRQEDIKQAKARLPRNSSVHQQLILPLELTTFELFAQIAQNDDLKAMFELLPYGISVVTDKSYKTILHNTMSKKFLRIDTWGDFPHSANEPLSVDILSNGHKISTEEMPLQRAALKGETVIGIELEFVWADGVRKFGAWNAVPLYRQGIIYGSMATCEDITERKRLENKLIEYKDKLESLVNERTEQLNIREQQYRTLVENVPLIISRLDKDLLPLYVNPAFKTTLGVTTEQCVEKTWGTAPNAVIHFPGYFR